VTRAAASARPKTGEIEAMYVQTAEGARATEGTLTLLHLSASTLYFEDRPQRVVGHMTPRHFVDLWTEGENSFAKDPPNAVVAFVDRKEMVDAVVVLRDPRLTGSRLTYSIEILDGDLPPKAGPITLFIDPVSRPLPPMSVAGRHRRSRRGRPAGPKV
jgi:hypothetical protein